MIQLIQASAFQIPLADESVQMVVTSPPYWGLRKYDGNQGVMPFGEEATPLEYVNRTIEVLREVKRVLRADGVCFWNIGDTYNANYRWGDASPSEKQNSNRGTVEFQKPEHKTKSATKAKNLCLIPERVAIAAQDDEWFIRSMIIWAKTNPMPEPVRDRPTRSYEHIIMLSKNSKYYWDKDAVAEPAKWERWGAQKSDKRAGGYGWIPDRTKEEIQAKGDGKRNIRNVWTISTQSYRGAHFATFPEELPRRCIKAASRLNDIVLDPFCGSGTTGKVAVELGRSFIGLDVAYQDLAKERIAKAKVIA